MPGTTVRDLMQRMGHDNERAAMIYLHATQGADRRIADALPVQLDGRRLSNGDRRSAMARGWHDGELLAKPGLVALRLTAADLG